MQLQRSYNRLRLYLNFPLDLRANRKTLGMQPELQYPRRSRFAPMNGEFIGWDKRSYVKEQMSSPVSGCLNTRKIRNIQAVVNL